MYKDRYSHIIIRICNIMESHTFQKLFFSLDITWGGSRRVYNDDNCYFVPTITKKENNILFYESDELNYIKLERKTDGIVYTIDNIMKVKQIIRNSIETPNYKPKRIKRKI